MTHPRRSKNVVKG